MEAPDLPRSDVARLVRSASDASAGVLPDEAEDVAHLPQAVPAAAAAGKLAVLAPGALARDASFPQAIPSTQPEQPVAVEALCTLAAVQFAARSCVARAAPV